MVEPAQRYQFFSKNVVHKKFNLKLTGAVFPGVCPRFPYLTPRCWRSVKCGQHSGHAAWSRVVSGLRCGQPCLQSKSPRDSLKPPSVELTADRYPCLTPRKAWAKETDLGIDRWMNLPAFTSLESTANKHQNEECRQRIGVHFVVRSAMTSQSCFRRESKHSSFDSEIFWPYLALVLRTLSNIFTQTRWWNIAGSTLFCGKTRLKSSQTINRVKNCWALTLLHKVRATFVFSCLSKHISRLLPTIMSCCIRNGTF